MGEGEERGEEETALGFIRDSIELKREMAAEDPGDADLQYSLANSLGWAARMQDRSGRPHDALLSLLEADGGADWWMPKGAGAPPQDGRGSFRGPVRAGTADGTRIEGGSLEVDGAQGRLVLEQDASVVLPDGTRIASDLLDLVDAPDGRRLRSTERVSFARAGLTGHGTGLDYGDLLGAAATIVGYEWGSTPGGNNLHRNVLFRDGPDRTKQILPFSAIHSGEPEKLWAFTITKEKTLTDRRLFKKFEDHGFDGHRCDVDGNLYVTRYGKGTVVKLSPKGEILREINVLGKRPSNLCFGGPDGRTIYVTEVDSTRLVAFRVDRPGAAYLRFKQ